MRTRSLPAALPEAPILELTKAQDLGARSEQEEEEGDAGGDVMGAGWVGLNPLSHFQDFGFYSEMESGQD